MPEDEKPGGPSKGLCRAAHVSSRGQPWGQDCSGTAPGRPPVPIYSVPCPGQKSARDGGTGQDHQGCLVTASLQLGRPAPAASPPPACLPTAGPAGPHLRFEGSGPATWAQGRHCEHRSSYNHKPEPPGGHTASPDEKSWDFLKAQLCVPQGINRGSSPPDTSPQPQAFSSERVNAG